jgi:hypothetical protein
VLSFALVLLAPACGGGGERLALEEFRTEANAVCSRAEERLQELPPPEDSPEGVVAYADRALPILRERQARLDELRPPEEEEQPFRRLLAEARSEADALDDLREAAERADAQAASAAASEGRIATVRVNALAVRLSLPECVRRPAEAGR